MSDVAIRVESLTKTYKLYNAPMDRFKESLSPIRRKYHQDFHALHDVTFEVKKGETIGILGKNGSGKSTLLKIIAGVLTPTSGRVVVNGKVSALLELGAGFNSELTGVENVYFNGTLMGYSKEEMDARLDDILSFADIGKFVYQPVKSYSSGMFVRLAFAVAVNTEPEILIVDEALSVGDALFTSKCLTKIEQFRQNGACVIFVTHDNSSIKSLCNRAVYLVDGSVACIGQAGDVVDKYIRDLREESLAIKGINPSGPVPSLSEDYNILASSKFLTGIESTGFNLQTHYVRYGSGEVRCINAEILDESGECVTYVEFDALIKIRLYLECYQEARFSVNYMIRDSTNLNILGSNFRIEDVSLIQAKPGEKYIVEYDTRVPVAAGDYNLLVEISDPIIFNKSAKFIDILENVAFFRVVERKNAKLWTKAYVQNKLSIIQA